MKPLRRSSVLLPALLAGVAAPAPAQIDFLPAVEYPAGSKPAGGALLDVDLDGHPDLIVSCRGDDVLAFLRNHGDGTFEAPLALALANNANPEGIATGDFDHDGDVDLAVALFGAHALQLVLANGDGTFTPGATFPLGVEPSMVVADDFDGDGWLDVAVNERLDGDVAVLINDEAGDFGPATFLAVGDETRDVVSGDVTFDGLPDLLVSARDDRRVRVFENQGGGAFAQLIDLSYGSQLEPHGIGLADLDGDGKVDLYSVSRGSVFEAPQVFLRFNGGNPWVGPINGAFAGVGTVGVVHGDFDLDGFVDVATGNADSNDVSIMRNAGGGFFNRGIEFPIGGDHPDCPAMVAADLDGDDDLDVVTFNEGSDDVSVLRNAVRVKQEDLGFGGPGSALLVMKGEPFATGKHEDLTISGASPDVPAFLLASLSFNATPFKGGTLVPVPFDVIVPMFLAAGGDGSGGGELPGIPGGGGPLDAYLQAAIVDPAQPKGFAFTNAVKLEILP